MQLHAMRCLVGVLVAAVLCIYCPVDMGHSSDDDEVCVHLVLLLWSRHAPTVGLCFVLGSLRLMVRGAYGRYGIALALVKAFRDLA